MAHFSGPPCILSVQSRPGCSLNVGDWHSNNRERDSCFVHCVPIKSSTRNFGHVVQWQQIAHRRSHLSLVALLAEGGLMFCLCFLFIFFVILNDFCQTNYLNIYRADLRQICRDGRTVAVDKGLKLVFRSLKGRCRGNQFLLALSAYIHGIGFAWHSVDGGVRQEVQVLRLTQANL